MKPRQAFDAEREEAAALPRPARRDPALAMAKRQVLVLLGAWLAVRALLMPAALLAGPQNADFWISGAVGLAVSVLVAAFILSGMRALAGLAMLAMAVSAVQTVPALLEVFFLRRRPGSLCGAVSGRAGSTAGTIGLSVFPARCEAVFQCVRAERKKR